jgi:perosamine synthetase
MNFIPLASPDINDYDIIAVSDVLKSGMLVQGKNVDLLEKNISTYLSSNYLTFAVSNGTATMHLALLALGIGPGDEVIVPAFSYIATANVVELVGAKPIFVDIDEHTFNIDVTKIQNAITKHTKAIIPVHEFGLACDIFVVMEIAKENKLFVIEDAACALGAKQGGQFVGTFGDFGSFSLHPRKAISSGEGGLLTTKSLEFARKINILRNHGIEIIDGKMEFVEAGLNYRMTDFQAALVNNQLKRFNTIISKKQELSEIYLTEIRNPKVKLPLVPKDRNHTWQTFHILLDESVNRDKVISDLKLKGIGTNYGAQCIPMQKYYLNKYGLNSLQLFPNSLKAYKQGLAIPMYEKLSNEQIIYISRELSKI